jgi:uncharacterized membrane protein (DUF4010 family)
LLTIDLELAKVFGEAIAIGLFIGVERYKSRKPGDAKSAGVRTFPLVALLGAVCALLGTQLFTVLTLLSLVVFLGIGYHRQTEQSLGLTTELAALLTFWFGYLVRTHETLIIATAIVVVILLASKQALHGFVRGQVTEVEFYDTLKFLAVVFVVFPLLPNEPIGPYEIFNPTQAWFLVILVSTISYSGYLLVRFLGAKRGLQLGAILGGLVSTVAVTVSLAQRAREDPDSARLLGVTAVMANAVQYPRLLILIWAVEPELALTLALPFLAAAGVGVGGALVLDKLARRTDSQDAHDLVLSNPYSFWPAAKFAALFVAVLAGVRLAEAWLGTDGVYLVSGLAGLADASAISMSVAELTRTDVLGTSSAAWAVVIAVSSNAVVKGCLALANGTRELALWLVGGLVSMVAVASALLLLT